MAHSALGPIPGWVVLVAGLIYNGALLAIGLFTAGLTQASGEVLPKFGEFPVLSNLWEAMEAQNQRTAGAAEGAAGEGRPANGAAAPSGPGHAPAAPPSGLGAYSRRRQQLLAFIIATKPQAVADRILKDLRRGVTALHGRGMYTQQDRDVLMVAVTITEMNHLKALVDEEDPNAFVVVSPAREVFGRGFSKLHG
jgi:hypothetical protein